MEVEEIKKQNRAQPPPDRSLQSKLSDQSMESQALRQALEVALKEVLESLLRAQYRDTHTIIHYRPMASVKNYLQRFKSWKSKLR